MAIDKIGEALRQALIEEMDKDEKIVLIGEDIGVLGGPYRVTEGLMERYGEERVMDAPISENVIVGAGVGAAMTGLRPVVEIQFNDFLTCAMDQVCNQAAKIRFMMGGQVDVPLVIRCPIGATGRAAQHSQSLEAWFMHTPGLKVVMPSTPYDAKGLLKTAIRDNSPVMVFEHKMLYGGRSTGGKARSAVDGLGSSYRPASDEEYTIPFGEAVIRREGSDVTIVATSLMVYKALDAAAKLAEKGIDAEVIDPRTLVPLDEKTIIDSVDKTGRLVIATEDVSRCGVSAEISALIAEKALFSLEAPIKRVAVQNTPIPFAPICENDVIPGEENIIEAVNEMMEESV
ncbi:MAG: alpha-ketoacid dehydrogenase subunit beta [bacterium]|nr:alpha-ketoacid dehydrogenase subunit beta [bacterium]